jgi:diguanylate cyclase (GGDEF)-like protein
MTDTDIIRGLQARVLIVDDSYMVAEMLSTFLGRQGCEISYALDGVGALAKLKEDPPDLIIADWVMPNMDGLELCKRLRQLPEFAWIYYIIMTAREGNDNMETALEAGADEFLSKPFQSAELMTRVRAGLRIVEVRRQRLLQPTLPPTQIIGVDTLAAVGSRQDLVKRLPRYIAHYRSQQEPLSIFVLRLGNLAQLSRDLPPEQRQKVVDQFTLRLLQNLRQRDVLFRYDEGQFVAILSGTTLPAAQLAVERCGVRMVQQAFVVQDQPIEVHLQYGAATLQAEDDNRGINLLKRAAQAMRDPQHPNLISPLVQVITTPAERELQQKLTMLEAENLELRRRIGLLEEDNLGLKQKLQPARVSSGFNEFS